MLCAACTTENPDAAAHCRLCGATLSAAPSGPPDHLLPPGTKLLNGAYTVGRALGQGGFGITYQGSDKRLSRPVAIKEFFPSGCTRRGPAVQPTGSMNADDYRNARSRFLDEARLLAQFHHPGIVRVFNTFEANNTAYMAMELLRGETLLHLIEEKTYLPERDAVSLLEQIGEALEVVHRAGLLHRDVKPDNVMIVEGGRAVLVDFGSARAFAAGRTNRMTAMLTPGYAPLEQYGQQARFGAFTDVYALGATLYHALAGQSPPSSVDRAGGVELAPPQRLNRAVSRPVSQAILWAMEMAVKDRPQSVEEFLRALRGRTSPNRPASTGEAATVSFKFRHGEARSVAELVDLCDAYPSEAEDYLFHGYFERWLSGALGEAAHAGAARNLIAAYGQERNKGLELFVRELCKTAGIDPYPQLVAEPSPLDLGAIPVGAAASTTVRLKNRGRGIAWGEAAFDPPVDGLSVPSTFGSLDDSLELRLDALAAKPGKRRSELVLQPEGAPTPVRVPVQWTILPLQLEIQPPVLDLGKLPYGGRSSVSVKITSQPTGGRIQGTFALHPPLDGLSLSGNLEGSSCELHLDVNTTPLRAGSHYETRIRLTTNAGKLEIPVRFQIPLRWDLVAYWMGGVGLAGGVMMGLLRTLLAGQGGMEGPFLSLDGVFVSGSPVPLACGLFGLAIAATAGIGLLIRRKGRDLQLLLKGWRWRRRS